MLFIYTQQESSFQNHWIRVLKVSRILIFVSRDTFELEISSSGILLSSLDSIPSWVKVIIDGSSSGRGNDRVEFHFLRGIGLSPKRVAEDRSSRNMPMESVEDTSAM